MCEEIDGRGNAYKQGVLCFREEKRGDKWKSLKGGVKIIRRQGSSDGVWFKYVNDVVKSCFVADSVNDDDDGQGQEQIVNDCTDDIVMHLCSAENETKARDMPFTLRSYLPFSPSPLKHSTYLTSPLSSPSSVSVQLCCLESLLFLSVNFGHVNLNYARDVVRVMDALGEVTHDTYASMERVFKPLITSDRVEVEVKVKVVNSLMRTFATAPCAKVKKSISSLLDGVRRNSEGYDGIVELLDVNAIRCYNYSNLMLYNKLNSPTSSSSSTLGWGSASDATPANCGREGYDKGSVRFKRRESDWELWDL